MADGADDFIYIRIPNESSSGKGLSPEQLLELSLLVL